jgi:hypothetical protein
VDFSARAWRFAASLWVGDAVADQVGEVYPHLIAGLDGLPHFVCLCTVGVMQGEQRVGGFLSGIRNGEDVGGGPQDPPAQTFLPVLTGLNLSLNKERRHFRAPSSFPGGHWRNLWGDRHRLRLEHRGRQKKSGLPLWHPSLRAISDRRQ